MARTLKLASKGHSNVQPNPMVGCLIVLDGEVIAEGYHEVYGGPHAEVVALEAIQEVSKEDLCRATAYVTLEPCSHFGQTPPCVDLLIERGVGRVVTAMEDPNPEVSGEGHKRLKDAGVIVETGVMSDEGAVLNRIFLSNLKSPLPYITLKWAESSDGFMDPEIDAEKNRGSYPISSGSSKELVHRLRATHNGILVGRKTVEVDNPRLTTRDAEGVNPYRIVLDPDLTIDHGQMRMHDEEGVTFVVCNSNKGKEDTDDIRWIQGLDLGLTTVMMKLREKGVYSILVEGGAHTLKRFIDDGVWNEARVLKSNHDLGGGLKAPVISGECVIESLEDGETLTSYIRKSVEA